MNGLLKYKWWVAALWIVILIALLSTAPNMSRLVEEKGQIGVPEGYPSEQAQELLKTFQTEASSGRTQVALVLYDGEGLTDERKREAAKAPLLLWEQREALGIVQILDPFTTPTLEDQLLSEDRTTALVSVTVQWNDRSGEEVRKQLYEALEGVEVEHYYTSDWMIDLDVVESSQEGLKKTEWITVVFILVILFAVFRSAVAPFIPLLTVGISYLVAQSVVAFLAEYADFPLSTFTQIFMVAVMFGIGTDYCILLISRFQEELVRHNQVVEAVKATYRHSGKTVLFAGLAVLVGFTSIGFSTFQLYKSAAAVAVGVAVMLLALMTIVPFFLSLLGRKLFWPNKRALEHKESRLWLKAGQFSFKRPVAALLVTAVVVVPPLLFYNGSLSYNALDEIGEKYDSVKAFNRIAESFGPGESLPSTVVIRADEPLDRPEALAAMERVSARLADLEGVKTVRSATRPTGEPIPAFTPTARSDQASAGQAAQGLMADEQFQQALGLYLSPDHRTAKLEVVLAGNPYAAESLELVGEMNRTVKEAAEGTLLANAEMAIGGVTSVYHDLDTISQEDYRRTVILMLIGIALILLVLLRSWVMPIYLIGSLVLIYYTAMAISEWIYVDVAGYAGISWAVPFFAYVMLVALGVDYSIFLMARFNEHREWSVKDGMLNAMTTMGTVILSAALILGGTFAAMMPSGVLSLLQIATIVLIGLALYSLVMLPLFVPVMVKWFERRRASGSVARDSD